MAPAGQRQLWESNWASWRKQSRETPPLPHIPSPLVIGRTWKRNPGRAVVAGLVFEFLDQPRFATASLATEQDDLARARLRLRPALAADTQLVFPTGSGCEARLHRHRKATLRCTLRRDSIQGLRCGNTFQLMASLVFCLAQTRY